MNDYLKDYEIQRKREYHRKWRAEHPDSVRAAQVRYWAKKAAEIRENVPDIKNDEPVCHEED